jgi:hypothetical protein
MGIFIARFHSTDDIEATKQAEKLADGHDVELWQRDRKIARFGHKPKIQF